MKSIVIDTYRFTTVSYGPRMDECSLQWVRSTRGLSVNVDKIESYRAGIWSFNKPQGREDIEEKVFETDSYKLTRKKSVLKPFKKEKIELTKIKMISGDEIFALGDVTDRIEKATENEDE